MKNYNLQADEVVLYKGNVTMLENEQNAKLILTNLNIVFIEDNNVALNDAKVEVYSIQEIKMYEEKPQIISKGNNVEIYLVSTEKELKFSSKIELHNFIKVATKLLTGKTSAERCADKVKKGIKLVDDTLGINVVSATGNVLKNATGNVLNKGIGALGKVIKKK